MKPHRPLRHHLLTLAASTSLLFFVTMILLWLRSFLVADQISRNAYFIQTSSSWRCMREFRSQAGSVAFIWTDNSSPITASSYSGADWSWHTQPDPPAFVWVPSGRTSSWSKAGLGLSIAPNRISGGYSMRRIQIVVPILFLALLATLLPIRWLVVRRRIRRLDKIAKGLCPECLYDLTANQSGICPECGTAIPPFRPQHLPHS